MNIEGSGPSGHAVEMRTLIARWRMDPGGTYQTWFLWNDRIKNFRGIRRGVAQVVTEIEADTFGNTFKGSSLETVVHSVAEQRQIFKGADHAFLWKPKLRIPDIYENRANQLVFARALDACCCTDTESGVLAAIDSVNRAQIKGLGPAMANLLPAPDHRPAVQHRRRERLQRGDRVESPASGTTTC